MKRIIVSILFVSLILAFVSGCVEKPGEVTPTPTPDLSPFHLNPAIVSSEKCKECHNVNEQKSLNKDIKPTHPLHLQSPLLKFECSTCHKKIDLNEALAGFENSGGAIKNARNIVDYNVCTKCHSSLKQTHPAIGTLGCVSCHSNWKEVMANVSYVNMEAVTQDNCLKCHGEQKQAWYTGR